MRLLFIILLLTSQSFASFEIVKEIDGIAVPKGITAQYDKFENNYIITTKDGSDVNMTLCYIYASSSIKTYIEIGFNTTDNFIDADQIDIFIENTDSDFKKHTVDWAQKNVSESVITENTSEAMLLKIFDLDEFSTVERKSSKSIREFSKTNDPELFNFLLNNLDKKSTIVMRFKNTTNNNRIDVKVEKSEIKDLIKMIELYKSLTAKSL